MFRKLLMSTKGAAAVEFALIAPLLVLTLVTFIAFGIYLSAAYSVQQIASDAARSAVAGLSARERNELANNSIAFSVPRYPFLRPEKLAVSVADDPADARQFVVALSYDASSLPIWGLYTFVMPRKSITSTATIRLGGL